MQTPEIRITTDEPITTDLPEEYQLGSLPNDMTPSQENHLLHLKGEFIRKLDTKYRAGAAEHGGDIRDNSILQLIDEGLAECVDQYTYLSSIRSELMKLKDTIGFMSVDEVSTKLFGEVVKS